MRGKNGHAVSGWARSLTGILILHDIFGAKSWRPPLSTIPPERRRRNPPHCRANTILLVAAKKLVADPNRDHLDLRTKWLVLVGNFQPDIFRSVLLDDKDKVGKLMIIGPAVTKSPFSKRLQLVKTSSSMKSARG